jgi:ubiquinol-cytochrome c reductase iron-sulfur subunit
VVDVGRDDGTRRDFLRLAGWTGVGIGAALAARPLVHQLNPTGEVRALATVKADLTAVEPGMVTTVTCKGKPVWVHHTTEEDIAAAATVPMDGVRDRATYDERVQHRPWLVQIG